MIDHSVPDEHLKFIGDITVSFALLELHLQILATGLIYEHQRIGQIICAELSFQKVKALVLSLYMERHGNDDEDLPQLRELLGRATGIEEKRNNITHSLWSAGPDADTISRSKTTAKEKHGVRFHFESMKTKDLKDIADSIKVLAHDMLVFYLSLWDRGKLINNPGKKFWPVDNAKTSP